MTDEVFRKGQIGFEDIQFGDSTFIREDHDRSNKSFTEVNLSQIPRKIVAKTANYTITEKYATVFTNTGATGTIVFTLPVAKAGLGPYEFLIDAAFQVDVDPNGTEYFRDCAAGKKKYSSSAGNILRVWCNILGIWEFDYQLVTGKWDNES